MNTSDQRPRPISRRRFLKQVAAAGAGGTVLASNAAAAMNMLRPVVIDNPLSQYPNRGWEKVYRDLYHHDSSFTFLCAPNDTHNCLLRGFVKNGVVTRIAPTYGYHQARDLDGNGASRRWDPRCCQKGLALARRFYGDRRIKKPLVRKGWLDWVKAGFPRDPRTGAPDSRYMQRGRDSWTTQSWDEVYELAARALDEVARAYTGEDGKKRLLAQGYDPLMVDAAGGAGTQMIKLRGGMPALGMTRVFAQYRFANSLALLDSHIRGVGPDTAVGGRGFDNYSWHTDLPPGHPMVTGQQTVDFDLCNVEYARLILVWGMNWITTKMPDSHWLTEARMKGARVIVIACEYSATANKGDEVLVVRPGTTPALALGFAQVLMSEKRFDVEEVKEKTDLPHLVRMDTGRKLSAADVFENYAPSNPKNGLEVLPTGEKAPPMFGQDKILLPQAMREALGDCVVWDRRSGKPVAVRPDQVGDAFRALRVDPALEGTFRVALTDGRMVECRPVFDVTREMLDSSYTPEQVEKITWAPADAVRSIARQIAANPQKTLFAMGMGPNQFFNNDLKDRAVFLVAALTGNIGRFGGNVGSYAGNYRTAYFNGIGQYIAEDPFNIQADAAAPASVKRYFKAESVHYFNHGDQILRMGDNVLTGKTHLPTPTKAFMVSNSNSLIGNVKGHYDFVINTLSRVEFIAVSDWWWTASCEYADIVFPVDSWAEFKYPDMTVSVTNPFLYTFPVTPLPRIHDTRSDVEVAAGISKALGRLLNDTRFADYWRHVEDGRMRPYIQRILNASSDTRGYRIESLEADAEKGIPAILQSRTYPKVGAWEQTNEDKPYYTRSGRLEFYRDEAEFMDSGENLLVHREPIDSTFYEPNVIVARPHPLLRPKGPEKYGVDPGRVDGDTRQGRHVVRSVEEMLESRHPLREKGFRFVFHTPKYRHGAHTTPVDTDIVAVWFGPFGDMYRTDPRMPFVTEAYVDINPADAKEIGVEDGDYVFIDADPHDRPFRGWEKYPEGYKVARLTARARYYNGTPRGITRMWHNMYGSTFGSVRGAATNPTGIAKSPDTGYQSLFRTGSHQSCTRGWLKPTHMTDSLTIKTSFGQEMKQGFEPDVHCPTGAPRESCVKITRAESGGIGGVGLWRFARQGLRPTYEHETLLRFIEGGFVVKS